MGWFTRKITDPDEAFARLISPDKKVAAGAKEEFIANLNHDLVEFLCRHFDEAGNLGQNTLETRLKILEIFAARHDALSNEDLRSILKLLSYPDSVLRETFKEILQSLNEERLRPVTEVLCSTSDTSIRNTLQHAIVHSGILDRLLKKWSEYTTKEKILYLEEIVLLQNPATYPIFMDILKEEVVESKKEEKRIIQVEFGKHIEKIKDPAFLDLCMKNLPNIDPLMWYQVFKCCQYHGEAFFKQIFQDLGRKSEGFRLTVLKLIEQLSDPISYPYLFPYLLDKFKSIPPVVQNTIQAIIKRVADELDAMDEATRNSPKTLERINFFTKPLEECLNDRYMQASKILSECLLRLGRHQPDIILRNLPKIHKYNENYLLSFLKGQELAWRKTLLIDAVCYKELATGRTALLLLSNPTENYIIDTLNSLLLEHFMKVPAPIQAEVINLMMDPRLKRFVEEVLYHQDPALRTRILQILGESGSANALQILVSKMRDPDYSVREAILNLLKLKHFQTPEGTEALMEFLKDTEQSIILHAIELLKERDHPKLLGNFSKLLTSKDPKLREEAHKAIAYVTRRKFIAGFDKLTPEAKYAIGTSLIKMDPTFLEDVTRDLSAPDQRTRVLSARILEVLCDHIPPELKTNLIVAIQDPDPHVRAVVIMGLGKIGGPSVANMLVEFLKDQDDRVRANAVEAMANVGDLTLAEAILPCLYDKNNRVRANTIMTLWRLGYYQIYDAVIDMLRNPDKWMRASAAYALGELRDARFFPVLVGCLRDPDPDVRRNVVRAMGKLAEPVVVAPYIRPLRFDPDEGVRKAVSEILTAPPKPKAAS
jgi:HEAT repeat protein